MAEIDEIMRKNPKAAAALESARETIDALSHLRAIGVAKGDQNRIIGRGGLGDLPPSRGRLRLKISK